MPEVRLECSRCGAPFRETDIDARKQSATCRFCGAVTALSSEPEAPPPETVSPAPAEEQPSPSVRPKVPRPGSIAVEDTIEGVRLTYRWFTPVLFFLLFFCIALLKDGREEKLATFNSADEARFVERTLEEALGVEHHAIAGELG